MVWEGGGPTGRHLEHDDFLKDMARSMPPMLQVMKDVGGVEMPEFVAKLTPDAKAEPTANGVAPKA